MDKKYAVIGFLRGIGMVLLVAGLSYIGAADNLPFLSPAIATIVAGLALSVEHMIESSTGRALFGLVAA